MFDFNEELKYYEPGLELLEDSLSGQEEKDLVELMSLMLQAKTGERFAQETEPQAEAANAAASVSNAAGEEPEAAKEEETE